MPRIPPSAISSSKLSSPRPIRPSFVLAARAPKAKNLPGSFTSWSERAVNKANCRAKPTAPDEKARIDLVIGVVETREAALGLIEKYHYPRMADRAFELAWTHSQVVLRQLNASEADAQLYSRLASALIYANPARRAAPSVL